MIQNLKTQDHELTMLASEIKLEKGTEWVELSIDIGTEEQGVTLFTVEMEFNLEKNTLHFDHWNADFYGLSQPELIIMQTNILEKLLKRSETDQTYSFLKKFRLKLVTMGHVFKQQNEEETKIVTERWGKPKKLQEHLEDREKARMELTYFEKHAPVRQDILTFIERMGKAETTEKTYYYGLEKFFEYVMENHFDTFPKIDELIINEFVQKTYRIEKKSAYYVNRLVAAIMSFVDFLEEEGMHAPYFQKSINRKRLHLPKMPRLSDIQPRSIADDHLNQAEMYLMSKYLKAEDKVNKGYFGYRGAFRDTKRNLFLFRVLLYGGLRINEALSLDFSDVKIGKRQESSYFVIRGKGGKERQVPILPEIREDLKNYMAWRRENDVYIEFEKEMRHLMTGRKGIDEFLTSEEADKVQQIDEEIELLEVDKESNKGKINYLEMEKQEIIEESVMNYVKRNFNQEEMQALFVSNRSKRVAPNTMQVMFNQLGKEKRKNKDTGEWEAYNVGIYAVQAHQLRHTCIKNLVDKNVPVNVIQLFSGHDTADMVMRYSKPTFEEMAEQIEKAQRKKE